jgi:hypothetical protein
MIHVGDSCRYGAWVVTIDGERKVFEGVGTRTLPALDKYYKPKPGIEPPEDWRDYTKELLDGAEDRWLQELKKR